MTPALAPLAALFALHDRRFVAVFAGVGEAQARQPAAPGTNHLAFLGAHLAESRGFLARRLGTPLPEPFEGRLAAARSQADVAVFPSIAEILGAWGAATDALAAALARQDPAALTLPAGARFPIDDPTRLGMIAFLAHHEAYHLGQMMLVRRALGLPA